MGDLIHLRTRERAAEVGDMRSVLEAAYAAAERDGVEIVERHDTDYGLTRVGVKQGGRLLGETGYKEGYDTATDRAAVAYVLGLRAPQEGEGAEEGCVLWGDAGVC